MGKVFASVYICVRFTVGTLIKAILRLGIIFLRHIRVVVIFYGDFYF